MRRIGVQLEASDSVVDRNQSWCLWAIDRLQRDVSPVGHSTGE